MKPEDARRLLEVLDLIDETDISPTAALTNTHILKSVIKRLIKDIAS
jgi:hypothetical protein